MSILSDVGSFNITTQVATSTVEVTGVGFQPKAIILWWSGRTESVNTIGRADANRGVGIATSTTERGVTCAETEDAQGTSNAHQGFRLDACVAIVDATANDFDGRADLQSLDSDGFTLVIDQQFSTDVRVNYLALAGDSITDATVGSITAPITGGTQAYTGVGFQPDFLLSLRTQGEPDSPGTTASSGGVTVGATSGTAAANNANLSAGADTGEATSDTWAYCLTAESFVDIFRTSGTPNVRGILDSFDSDGFTVNWLEVTAATKDFIYLALKGGNYLVGELTTRTDTTQFSQSGFGFEPAAVLFCSHCKVESPSNASDAEDAWSVGAATSASERACMGAKDENGLDTTEVTTALRTDAAYVNIASDSTVDGLMDLVSMDSGGFTTVMDDADPSARFVWYVAFGPAAPAPPAAPAGLVRIIGT
jgi:hypothetical protein